MGKQFVKTAGGDWINLRYVVKIGQEEETPYGVCRKYTVESGAHYWVPLGTKVGFPSPWAEYKAGAKAA